MAKNKNGNNINLELGTRQTGNIKVHTQIINDLSSGIYSSPASCIKELINNSYDADARDVVIRVKPIEDSITIIDDGNGMNAIDFDDNFAWISKSNKRNEGQVSKKMKRPLIGKIGIGFIAVNEICDCLEVISTKEGEAIKFIAVISFKNFRETDVTVDGGIIKGAYELINEEEDPKEHYTIIRLLGLKESVKSILDDQQYLAEIIKSERKDFDKTSFASMKDILLYHYKKNLKSFTEDNAYLQFIIDLASYIPVEYVDGGPISENTQPVISELINLHKNLRFKVDLDGIYLKKPIFFQKKPTIATRTLTFSETLTWSSNSISIKGYFYIQHGLLVPRELNGVAIRIRNIPIAERFGYDPTFMRYPNYMDQLFQNWISGEIYVTEGLEDAMNIDRKSFRVTHPHYLALQDWLHKYLRQNVFKVALEIYEDGKELKTMVETKKDAEEKKKIFKTASVTYSRVPSKSSRRTASPNFPIKITQRNKGSTVIEVDESLVKKFKKKDWEVLENVFLIFELAMRESKGDINLLKALFYQKINDWKEIK
jgi:hypothetical protein